MQKQTKTNQLTQANETTIYAEMLGCRPRIAHAV